MIRNVFTREYIILLIAMIAIVLMVLPQPLLTNDYLHHYYKAKGVFDEDVLGDYYIEDSFFNYPPLFSYISRPFSSDMLTFDIFLLVFMFLIPLILAFLLNNRFILITYLCIPFFFATWFASIYPQALASFLFAAIVILLLDREESLFNYFIAFLLAIGLFISHGTGPVLLGLLVLFVTLVKIRDKLLGDNIVFPFFLASPDLIELQASPLLVEYNPVVLLFKFVTPLLVLIKEVNKWIVLWFFFLLAAFVFDPRIINTASLMLCIGVAENLLHCEHRFSTRVTLVILLVCFLIQLVL